MHYLGYRMRAHVIQDGVIANIIVVDSLDALPGLIDADIGGSIGDSVVDGVVVPKPTPPKTRDDLKAERASAVAAIKVTTQAGNTFDGDEISQGRMARAIIALSTGLAPSVSWVLADNSVIQATPQELTEALVLSGQAQAAIWVIPE
jgi:hypothetical protein